MKKDKKLYITIATVFFSLIFQLFFIRYVSYSVDKEVYGNYVLLQTLVIALSYVFLQIPSSSYSRFFNEAKNKVGFVNEFRSLLIYINILSLLVITIYGYFFTRFSVEILTYLFLYFVLLNNYSFNKEIFLLNLERKKYFKLQLLESSAKYLFPIVFYYWHQTLESLVIGIFLGYFISFIFLLFHLKGYPFKYQVSTSNLKKYFKYANPVVFTAVFSWGISFSDRYFIDYFMKIQDVAIYAILAQVAGFGGILGQVYGMYVNPIVYKEYEKDKEKTFTLLNVYIRNLILVFVFVILAIIMLPVGVFTILIEKEVISNYVYYYTFLILVLSALFAVLQNAFAMYFVLEKKLHLISYAYMVAFSINMVGNFYVEDYGIIAAAISTVSAFIVVNIIQYYFIKKMNYAS